MTPTSPSNTSLKKEILQSGMAVEGSRKSCWNAKCGTSSSAQWSPGWLLRSGSTADLCDLCGLAYKQSRFCETFHSDDPGWRTCNSCKKRVHCGCIASVYGIVLLDKGGVECSNCAQAHESAASSSLAGKHGQQLLLAPAVSLSGKVDPAVRGWCEGFGAALAACNSEAGPWQPPPGARVPPSTSSGLPAVPRQPTLNSDQGIESSNFGDTNVANPVLEACVDSLGNDRAATSVELNNGREGSPGGSPESPGHVESSPPSPAKSGAELPAGTNLSGGSSPAIEGTCMEVGHKGLEGAGGDVGDVKAGGLHRPPRIRQLLPRPHSNSSAAFEPGFDPQASLRVARPPGEGRGRNQLLPRYWPRITDQELKQITSGENTVITPLFEKMLSASDAGRIGRLVLPKACAEAYFPAIHQPEGLPLRIQDVTGRDWVFQFRFWPNNNSRMYVLEGVTPCIQSMRLQAGDTVTFSRLEVDGKLVMGYRRAPTSLSSQDAGIIGGATTPFGGPAVMGLQSAEPWNLKVGMVKSRESTLAGQGWSSQVDRKRGRPLGSKSKRLRLDTDEALFLKSNWEEAQELLRPPPSAIPTTITIDGHEFEEYAEPPVFAKRTFLSNTPSGEQEQWVQCDDCGNWRRLPDNVFVPARWSCSQNSWDLTRAQCSAPQEVSNDKLDVLLGPVPLQDGGKQDGVMKTAVMSMGKDAITAAITAAAGLDTLAQAAAATLSPISPVRTTKHPRHRPGCSCIVCIQPPSGKGPKHKATCMCNVCVTVKRRFKTLMQRRKKRQFERESEVARKKREWARDDNSDSASLLDAVTQENLAGPTTMEGSIITAVAVYPSDVGAEDGSNKAAIDLNSQPNREERISMVRLLQDASLPLSTYLHQHRLATLSFPDPISDQNSDDPTSSREEVVSQTSSKALAESALEVPATGMFLQPQLPLPQSPYNVAAAEQSSHLEVWVDPRAGKPAEFSGDSVHSSSSKQEYSMFNQVAGANPPAKKYATGAGRGRQICSGCGEPIGSAAKVCRRCGTCTAFGKKKRGVPL